MNLNLKKGFSVIVLLIFAVLLLLPLIGCGAKKSESQKKEETAKQDFSGIFRNSGNSFEFLDFQSNLKFNSLTTFDEENETTTFTKSYSPINSTVPASFIDEKGNKQELNNTTYTEEKKTVKNKKKSEKSEKSEKAEKVKLENKTSSNSEAKIKKKGLIKKSDDSKKNDQQQWKFPFWILLLLVLILFLILAFLNKRFGWLKYVTAFVSKLFQFRKK